MTSQDKHKIDRLKRKVCDSIFSHVADTMWSYTKVWIQSWTWTRASITTQEHISLHMAHEISKYDFRTKD
jgi:hypothetical protein